MTEAVFHRTVDTNLSVIELTDKTCDVLHYIQIQKTWRGFYTRKYVANYYSRRRYLEAVKVKNEVVRFVIVFYSNFLKSH